MNVPYDDLLAMHGLAKGSVLADKYRVEGLLGRGGMGFVVAAHHLRLDTRVALKFLLSNMIEEPTGTTRFLREARAAARLRGEHVARVMDVAELRSGLPYLVMEYLDGADLATVLRDHGCPPVDVAVDYMMQACNALDEAHSAGIVHRDIKPSNLFLTRRANGTACVKVLDFGISKLASAATSVASELTATQSALGSPLYMSPEQLRTPRDADARSDLWSLGASAFEILCGSVPFRGETMAGLCLAIVSDSPEHLRSRRPEVPEALEAAVLRCLRKDPRERFASARELAKALAPFAAPAARAERHTAGVSDGVPDTVVPDVYAAIRMPVSGLAPAVGLARAETMVATDSAPPGPMPARQETMVAVPSSPIRGETAVAVPSAPYGAERGAGGPVSTERSAGVQASHQAKAPAGPAVRKLAESLTGSPHSPIADPASPSKRDDATESAVLVAAGRTTTPVSSEAYPSGRVASSIEASAARPRRRAVTAIALASFFVLVAAAGALVPSRGTPASPASAPSAPAASASPEPVKIAAPPPEPSAPPTAVAPSASAPLELAPLASVQLSAPAPVDAGDASEVPRPARTPKPAAPAKRSKGADPFANPN